MAVIKCKYCGGNVDAFPDTPLGNCSGCGGAMTLPANNSPERIAAHNGGNYYRRMGDYGKALAIYQSILKKDSTDAEASWGSALCRFGVEYVPGENGYTPVCHRKDGGSFLESGDYLAALTHSSGAVQLQYEREAAKIAQSQRGAASQPVKKADTSLLTRQAFRKLAEQNWKDANHLCDQIIALAPGSAMAYLGKLLAELQIPEPKQLVNCTQDFSGSTNYQALCKVADPELKKTLEACLHKVQKNNRAAQMDTFYRKALTAMKQASTLDQLHQLARAFGKLGNYQHAPALAKECLRRAEVLRRDSIYQQAVAIQETAESEEDFLQAATLYAKIPGWQDANVRLVTCRDSADAYQAMQSKHKKAQGWFRLIAGILCGTVLLAFGGYTLVTKYVIPERKYRAADALAAANERELAIAAFRDLGEYKDSIQRVEDIQFAWYTEADELLASGDHRRAAASFGGLEDYRDARERSLALWEDIVTPELITAGGWYTAGIHINGTAEAIGSNAEKQCNINTWYDLKSISAGWAHTAGLRLDGTVITAGYNGDGRGDTEDWKDIVDLSVGQWHTVGLQSNGRVIAIGCDNDGRTDTADWQEIIAVSAGRHHTIGLRADSTAIAVGNNEYGQCDLGRWRNLTDIAAGGDHSIGLREDGTVVAAGCTDDGQCNVDSWEDITAIAAGYYHTVGLRADGTVVATGFNAYGQCEVSEWKNIVAIAAGGWHTVGLKADGTVVAVGRNINNQCDTQDWECMMVPKK